MGDGTAPGKAKESEMRKILFTTATAAALALAAPAFAAVGDTPAPGIQDLGVDISNVGPNPASVGAFLAQLPPDGQQSVLTACQRILNGSTGTAPQDQETYSFCMAALS